jgi:copper homeostasis protein
LTSDRQIDVALWRKIVQLAGDRETVFHRAFDELADQAAAIATLVDLGTRRVLTSGGAATALAGSAQLARLIRRAGTGIEVLPAAGVSAEHIAQLIHATGCRQVHGSFLDRQLSTWRTSRSRVVAARAALDAL